MKGTTPNSDAPRPRRRRTLTPEEEAAVVARAARGDLPQPRGRRARRIDTDVYEQDSADAWTLGAPASAAGVIDADTDCADSASIAPDTAEPESTAAVPAASAAPAVEEKTHSASSAQHSAPSAEHSVSSAKQPAQHAEHSAAASPAPAHRRTAHEPRTQHEPREGSMPVAAGWTALTSLLPGSGLVTTPLRRLGITLLVLVVVPLVVGAIALMFIDPMRVGIKLLVNRNLLIGLLIGMVILGVVWCLQIIMTGLAQSTKERLRGARRVGVLVLSGVLALGVALPFGRGVESLWAAQGLLGSTTVFGGTKGEGRVVEGPDPWAGVGRINILLLGQDAGADRTGTRPDTIMVASIDTESGRTALFSIPRNLEHVRFPDGTAAAERFPNGFRYYGKNQDLINAVWSWAEDEKDLFPGDKRPGLTATTWAVEETLGLQIDYFAMVNLQGFQDLVDAIGGVEMEIERRIPIGGGTNQATGRKYKITGYIEPGMQKLDGYHALWYARSREGSDDFNRMCRQQRIVRVVTEEASPQRLAASIPGLVSATERNIETDIPTSDVDAFVDLALRIKDAGFTSYPITRDVTPSGNPNWDYLKEWTQASIEDSMKQVAPVSVASGEPTPAESSSADANSSSGGDSSTESGKPSSEEESSSPSKKPKKSKGSSQAPKKPVIDKDPLKSCMPGYEG